MQFERQKVAFDGLAAETVSLASSAQTPPVIADCCRGFVRLLDSIREPLDEIIFKEEDGGGILSLAGKLQVGFFRDLEILCILFDFAQQIVYSLEEFLSSEDHINSVVSLVKKRRFVSAFSVLQEEVNNGLQKPEFSRSRVSLPSFCLPRKKDPKSPALKPLKTPTEATEVEEEALKVAEEAHKIGGDYLKQLRFVILDYKDRLCKAAESLKAIFLSAEAQSPSFLVRAHLRKAVQCFLAFESLSSPVQDPIHECQETLCPIGYQMAKPTVMKIISELLDPGGPVVVGICGPGGVGKTSVASLVASNSKIKRRFIGGVFWVPADRSSDSMSLQSCLWKAISGSKTVFNSVEEGLVALKSKFLNCLPTLLIVDGVWEASQLEGLFCFNGKQHGKLIVTASNPEILPSIDTHIHTLNFVEDEVAFDLFQWGAGWNGKLIFEDKQVVTKLVKKCEGSPLFIQALSSTLYTRSIEKKQVLQILLNKGGEFAEDQTSAVNQNVKNQEPGDENTAESSLNVKNNFERATDCIFSVLFDCFRALGLVHPLLQECFLDLAAFPEGEWVSLSTLEELWLAFSNGLSHEEIVVILSILVCRSMVDWRLIKPDTCDLDLKIEFKLHGAFYNLASRISNQDIQGNTMKKHCVVHMSHSDLSNKGKMIEHRSISSRYLQRMKRMFGFDNAYISCSQEDIDVESGEPVIQTLENDKPLGANDFERIPDLKNGGKDSSNTNRTFWASRFHQEYRLFVQGYNTKSFQGGLLDESLLSRATKISLFSGNVQELPNSLTCPFLHVGLFGGNAKLSCLTSAVLRNMSQLQVLDLRCCASLTYLPRAISALKSLQLLDLSFCTSLRSLPSSFGHLKKLKFLRLLGCSSLTHLPKALGSLKDLEALQLSGCIKLKTLPSTIGDLSSLKILDLNGCFSLHSLPLSVGLLRELRFVDLTECSNLSYTLPYYAQLLLLVIGIHKMGSMAVPTGLWNCGQVEVLRLASLKNMTFLPCSVGRLQHIRHLDLSNCRRLEFLPEQIGSLWLLQELDLSHTAIRKLPDSVGKLGNLHRLCLQGCSRLLCLPSSISLLPKLRCLDMSECWDLVLLPNSIGNSNSLGELVELDLACCGFKSLPSFSRNALPKLKKLKLFGCYIINALPPTMELLTSLEMVDLEGCCALTSLTGIGLGNLEKLAWLSLRNCTSLTSLPTKEIIELKSLKYLDVSGCTGLSPFPQEILDHAREGSLTLIRWGAVWP